MNQTVGVEQPDQPVLGPDGRGERILDLGEIGEDHPHALGDRPVGDLHCRRIDRDEAAGKALRAVAPLRIGDLGVEQLHLGIGQLPPTAELLHLAGEQRGDAAAQVARLPDLIEEHHQQAVPAVGHGDGQHGTPALPHRTPLCLDDLRLHGHHLPDRQVREIGQLAAFLIAAGQMREQVAGRLQAEGIGEHDRRFLSQHVPKPRRLVDHTLDPARRHRQLCDPTPTRIRPGQSPTGCREGHIPSILVVGQKRPQKYNNQ